MGIIVVLVAVFLVGPQLWRVDPLAQSVPMRLQGISWGHPLGTDHLGRDLLARALHGGQVSLGVSLLVTCITVTIGVTVGGVASTMGRGIELLLMRFVDLLLAFPFLILALVVAGLSGGGIPGMMLALCLLGWGTYARVMRLESARIRAQPFVEAAHCLGSAALRVFLQHVLPNAAPPILVLAVARFAQTILTIAGLSFLGVGIKPPAPEWGAMLAEGLPYLERAPLVLLVPGIAVTLSCLLVSLAAERWREQLSGRSRGGVPIGT